MKKLLIATNLLTLSLGYLYSCTSTGGFQTSNGSYQMNKDPLFASCYNCVVDDIHGETADEFADVTARYKTTHSDVYNQYAKGLLTNNLIPAPTSLVPSAFEDARSCWFSLDTLDKFSCLMKKYSSKLGIPTSKLGYRFYYTQYPVNYPRDGSLSQCHTLYIAPTFEQGNMNIDFDPRESVNNGGASVKDVVTLASLINPLNLQLKNYLYWAVIQEM